ncbi:MAG: glycosyltransferase family 4 protein [Acidobacteria bacterium]|nr:glycosyltransferase family 4 protein [Acidobacteriota bacterium]
MMRILLINDHLYSAGGAERYVHAVARALAGAGDEVTVLYGSGGIQPLGGVRYECVPELLPLPVYTWQDRVRVFGRWLERLQPEVIQFNNLDEAAVLSWFSRIRPVVQFVHVQSRYVCPGEGKYYKREESACPRPFGPYCILAPYVHRCGTRRPLQVIAHYRQVARWLKVARSMKRLVTASDYMRGELLSAGIPDGKILVNPIGVEVQGGHVRAPSDPPHLVFPGRLYDYKGGDHLIRALSWIHSRCRVQVIGDGPEQGRLVELARLAPPHHEIQFLDWIEPAELRLHLRSATAVVIPSRWPEPYGLAGLEAMSQGVPVVAYEVGGVSQWMRDGVNGVLVRPGRIGELGEAIQRLILDPVLQGRLAAGALATAREFSMRRHVERLRIVYREAIGPPGSSVAA